MKVWFNVDFDLPKDNKRVLVVREYDSGIRDIGISAYEDGIGWIAPEDVQVRYWMSLPEIPNM